MQQAENPPTLETKMSFYYIASPYSHRDPEEVHLRFVKVMSFTAALMKAKVPVYSPIVHCHELSIVHKLPTTADYWVPMNHAMLEASIGTIVLAIPGWEESLGVQEEMAYTIQLGKTAYLGANSERWINEMVERYRNHVPF